MNDERIKGQVVYDEASALLGESIRDVRKANESKEIAACYRRAIELIWVEDQERTCGEIRRMLIQEFGQEITDAAFRQYSEGR